MNEVQTLRREIARQRRSLREIASAADSANDTRYNSVDYEMYLMFCVGTERKRLRAHLGRLHGVATLTDEDRSMLARAREVLQASDALGTGAAAPLESTDGTSTSALSELLLGRLLPAAQSLEAIAEHHYTIEDWRRAAHLDADSILEERRLRQQVRGHAAELAGR